MRQLLAAFVLLGLFAGGARACTRVLYQSPNGDVSAVGRTMDWAEDPASTAYLLPRGMAKAGLAGPGSLAWTSKYASLSIAGYSLGAVDALNERGLSASLLFFPDAGYGDAEAGGRPPMSVATLAQHCADMYANVSEAVDALRGGAFNPVGLTLPNGRQASLHLQLTDASGDAAVFEWMRDGSLQVYHSRNHTVMTNSPPYDEQLALARYWQRFRGEVLPGTSRPSERFNRALFYVTNVPKTEEARLALAQLRGIMKTVSVPLGMKKVDAPEASSTQWTSVLDQTHLRIYFEHALGMGWQWVDLAAHNTSAGAPVLALDWSAAAAAASDVTGDVTALMKPLQGAVLPPALAVSSDGQCDEAVACLTAWRAAQQAAAAGEPSTPAQQQ